MIRVFNTKTKKLVLSFDGHTKINNYARNCDNNRRRYILDLSVDSKELIDSHKIEKLMEKKADYIWFEDNDFDFIRIYRNFDLEYDENDGSYYTLILTSRINDDTDHFVWDKDDYNYINTSYAAIERICSGKVGKAIYDDIFNNNNYHSYIELCKTCYVIAKGEY